MAEPATTSGCENLTYEQEYEIPLALTFSDSNDGIKVAYHECGSHAINMSGVISLKEARRLRAYLAALPGIDAED